ncbi:MAG: hypothetical protein WCH61_10350, partial [bacterium]
MNRTLQAPEPATAPENDGPPATAATTPACPPSTLIAGAARLLAGTLLMVVMMIQAPNLAWAQGTVNFRTSGSVNAPVRDTDGTTLLAGDAFRAQLYVGPQGSAESALQAVGVPVPFLTGGSAGYVSAATVTVPGIAGGVQAAIQMRVWETAYGTTFEQALAAGGFFAPPAGIDGLRLRRLVRRHVGAAAFRGGRGGSLHLAGDRGLAQLPGRRFDPG